MAPRMIMLTDDILRDLVLIITDAIELIDEPQWSREDARAIRDFMEERAAEGGSSSLDPLAIAQPTPFEPLLEWEMAGKHPEDGWKATVTDGEYLIEQDDSDDSGAPTALYELTFTTEAGGETLGLHRDVEKAWKKAEAHNRPRKICDGLEKLKDGNLVAMLRSTTVDAKLTWKIHEERGGWYAHGFAGTYYAKPVGSEYRLTFAGTARGHEICVGGYGMASLYADMAALVTAAEEHNAIEIPPPACTTGRFDSRAPNRSQGPCEPRTAPESDAEPPVGTETPSEDSEAVRDVLEPAAREVVGDAREVLRLIVQSSRVRRLLGAINPDVLRMACEALGLPDSFVGSSEEKKE